MSDVKNSDDVEKFTDYLVELTAAYQVTDTGEIQHSDGTPVKIALATEERCLSSYRESSKLIDHLMLNIFTDNTVVSAPVDWFYKVIDKQIAFLLKLTFEKAIVHKEEVSDEKQYTRMELSSILKNDKSLLKDLDSIHINDLLFILYKRKDKTAQLQTNIFDPEWIKTKSIKEKNLDMLQKAFKHIFKFDDLTEFNENYKFISSMISIPQCEARLRILLLTLKKLEKYYCAFHTDIDNFNLEVFENNLPHLAKYYSIAISVNAPAAVRSELESKSNSPINIQQKIFKSPFGGVSNNPNITIQSSQPTINIIPNQPRTFTSPFANSGMFGASTSNMNLSRSPFA